MWYQWAMAGSENNQDLRLWRLETSLGPVELLRAGYRKMDFARHSHRRYCVGVIESGGLGFRYRGREVAAPAGSINLAVPGEPHTGHGLDERGWTYRMFYLPPEMMAVAGGRASEALGGPVFLSGAVRDAVLAARLRAVHLRLETGSLCPEGVEEELVSALELLCLRHADENLAPESGPVRDPAGLERVREYIEDNHWRRLDLTELADEAALSPFHLARIFGRRFGLPPHAYLNLVRVRRARQLLDNGQAPAAVAAEVGFHDQPHLTRRFKAVYGLTPGQYRKNLQD